jgi:hypothetical protein
LPSFKIPFTAKLNIPVSSLADWLNTYNPNYDFLFTFKYCIIQQTICTAWPSVIMASVLLDTEAYVTVSQSPQLKTYKTTVMNKRTLLHLHTQADWQWLINTYPEVWYYKRHPSHLCMCINGSALSCQATLSP